LLLDVTFQTIISKFTGKKLEVKLTKLTFKRTDVQNR